MRQLGLRPGDIIIPDPMASEADLMVQAFKERVVKPRVELMARKFKQRHPEEHQRYLFETDPEFRQFGTPFSKLTVAVAYADGHPRGKSDVGRFNVGCGKHKVCMCVCVCLLFLHFIDDCTQTLTPGR
jgi:hypothetical protein